MDRDVLAIVGPTASGKTAVAIEVARRIGGEIVSVDSRQVYRGMDIGTAKPSVAEQRGVPHHGFDLIDPDERYSAGRFARDAWRWIDAIRAGGRVPILAGGTGFFLRALTHPMFDEPTAPAARRESLKQWLRGVDEERLRRWAALLDPGGGWDVGRPGGRQRMARAVEVGLLTGRSLGDWQRQPAAARVLDPLLFVLELPRPMLRSRIDQRVDSMVAHGLAAEVAGLLARGYTAQDPGMSATGYAELVPYVQGESALEEALEQVRAATRRYARRQATWFRHQLPAGAVRIDATRSVPEIADEIVDRWSGEEQA